MLTMFCILVAFLLPYGLCRLFSGGGIDWIIPAATGFLYWMQLAARMKKQ